MSTGKTADETVPTGAGPLPRHDLPVLEAYRAAAALMVLLTHVGFASGASLRGPWAGWLSRLDFGVALFFLLSGFLLFRPYVQAAQGRRPPVATADYLWRRLVRIYPALVVVLVANWVITPSARDASATLWWQTLLMVQNYPVALVNHLPGLVQTWSLATEVAFYLALPLLARLVLGTSRPNGIGPGPGGSVRSTAWRPAVVLVVVVAVSLLWRLAYLLASDGSARELLWLPAFADWFAAGMALAWLRERGPAAPALVRHLAQAPGVCLSLALAGYWLVTTSLGGPYGLTETSTSQGMLKHVTYAAVAVLLLLPALFGPPDAPWRRVAGSAVPRWLGTISFGVFLWHPMLVDAIRGALDLRPFDGGFWITLALTLTAALLAGTLSWLLVEAPAQRRFRSLRPRMTDR